MADRDFKIPYGFCQCGCGEKTPLARYSDKNKHWVKNQPLSYINHHNTKPGDKTPNWRGGRIAWGKYPKQYAPNHPKASGNHVCEHILFAEKALGKILPDKTVIHHHTPEQLVVCENQAYHLLLHQRQRAYEACGHAAWRKCAYCKEWDAPENLYIPKGRQSVRHKQCALDYQRRKRDEKRQCLIVQKSEANPGLVR